jgi:hypothetical protein
MRRVISSIQMLWPSWRIRVMAFMAPPDERGVCSARVRASSGRRPW